MSQINKPSEYFNTKLYSGNSSTQSITGVGFQPDWTWIKYRNDGTYGHDLYDAVRGATKTLNSNNTNAEYTSADRLTLFDSDGFSLGSNASVNNSGGNYVAWNWLAGGTGVSNTDGSITSTVSANTTSGFSIVSYTGNGSAGSTIGHGLGVAPAMIITKVRSTSNNWMVYHKSLPITEYLIMNSTVASQTDNEVVYYDTAPSSSVFTIGNNGVVNGSGSTYIAYCFAEKKGFSKFGSYTGNGSADGTFVYTGFKPAFVIFKNTTTANRQWYLMDNKRNTYNVANIVLAPNQANDESWWGTGNNIDFLSNGIKIRSNSDINNSGDNFIYMAFAENPLVGTNNIPTTAR